MSDSVTQTERLLLPGVRGYHPNFGLRLSGGGVPDAIIITYGNPPHTWKTLLTKEEIDQGNDWKDYVWPRVISFIKECGEEPKHDS